jgi:hypothetical protein
MGSDDILECMKNIVMWLGVHVDGSGGWVCSCCGLHQRVAGRTSGSLRILNTSVVSLTSLEEIARYMYRFKMWDIK